MKSVRCWRQAVWMVMILCTLSGCGAAFGTGGAQSVGASEADEADLASLRYPKDAPFGQDMDVLILPESQHITIVNRSVQPLENMQLWLNQQYVGRLDSLGVGARKRMSLSDFVNRHGESFPTAGFLTPDRALLLVHTELFDPRTGHRHRAVVMLAGD